MANRVVISVIGAASLAEDQGRGQAASARMIDHWQRKFDLVLPDRPDLILVPECCDRYAGQTIDQVHDYYHARGDRVRELFAQVAAQNACHVAYAAVRAMPDGSWRNSIQLLAPDGQVAGVYDKNHPTIGEMRDAGIQPGIEAPIIECDLGGRSCRVACVICFDLNFCELWLQYARARPDLILFASMYHGGLMQAYWAYACRAHLASAISGLASQVIDPLGRTVATTTNYIDYVTTTVNLDCCLVHLDNHWEKLEALKRAYGTEVSILDPGYLGPVLVSSESPARSVDQLLAEFEMEPLDDYFDRSRAERQRYAGLDGEKP